MTNAELHTLIDQLMDKSDLPWFTTAEKDQFINLAILEYVKQTYSSFEVNEKNKQNLSTLVRKTRIANSPETKTFMLSTLRDCMYILSVSGSYTDTCYGKSIYIQNTERDVSDALTNLPNPAADYSLNDLSETTHTNKKTDESQNLTNTVIRSIKPVQLDDYKSSLNDPFNKPSDRNPMYVLRSDQNGHPYIEILSDTAPTNIYVDYLKIPASINTTSTPSGTMELPSFVHEEIANIAVRKMLENIENPLRYKTHSVEVQEQNR